MTIWEVGPQNQNEDGPVGLSSIMLVSMDPPGFRSLQNFRRCGA